MRLLAGTVTALLAVAGSTSQAPDVGTITGRVTLTSAVRGVPLASNVYQPRAVGRHEPGQGTEIQNVVVYLKGAAFQGILPTARRVVEQRNETFAPRVTVVTRGSVVAFPNDDPTSTTCFRCPAPGPSISAGTGKARRVNSGLRRPA
jgi:hypothetical protein